MAIFTPSWPLAVDVLPQMINGTTPVVGQWLNMAATLVEILEGEIGLNLIVTAVSTIIPTTNLQFILNAFSNSGLNNPGRVMGIKRLQVTQTEAFWNPGTNTIVFNSSLGKNLWSGMPGKPGVCFGTYIGTAINGAWVAAQPFGVNIATGPITDSYNVMGSSSWLPGAGGGTLVSGTYTFDFILIQVPEYE